MTDPSGSLPVTIAEGATRYVWGLGLAYAVTGSDLEVIHTDRLGSVRAVTDDTGAVIATVRTDEFGIPTVSTGSASVNFGFTGEPVDGTGLVFLRSRSYDPTLGRFLTRDTWAGAQSVPGSLHRFAYVGNNPASYTDPSGHCLNLVPGGAFVGAGAGAVGGLGVGAVPGAAIGAVAGAAACAGIVGLGIVAGIAGGVLVGEAVLDQKEGDIVPPVYQPLAPGYGPPPRPPAPGRPGDDPFDGGGPHGLPPWAKAVAIVLSAVIASIPAFGVDQFGEPIVTPRYGPIKPQALQVVR